MPVPEVIFGQRVNPAVLAWQQLSWDLPVTSTSGEDIATIYGLDQDSLRGKAILDVGGGCSDFVSWLGQRGVHAVAVDPGYVDVEDMLRRAEQADAQIAQAAAMMNVFAATDPKLQRAIHDGTVVPRQRFLEDFQQHPDRYVPASVLDLEFADNSFDEAYSNTFLTSEPGRDREFLMASLYQMLRVVRPGGSVRLGVANMGKAFHPQISQGTVLVKQNINEIVEAGKRTKQIRKMTSLCPGGEGWIFRIEKR